LQELWLLVILGQFPIKRLFGKRCSIIFSILAIFMPIMLNSGLEIRMYSWATVFVTASAIYAYSIIVNCKLSYWIKFTVFSIAGAYTHYYALLSIAIIYFLLFVWLIFMNRKQLRNLFYLCCYYSASIFTLVIQYDFSSLSSK